MHTHFMEVFRGRQCFEGQDKRCETPKVGLDPLLPAEEIWQKLYDMSAMNGRRGVVVHALGAIDTALWDLKGQARASLWVLARSSVRRRRGSRSGRSSGTRRCACGPTRRSSPTARTSWSSRPSSPLPLVRHTWRHKGLMKSIFAAHLSLPKALYLLSKVQHEGLVKTIYAVHLSLSKALFLLSKVHDRRPKAAQRLT